MKPPVQGQPIPEERSQDAERRQDFIAALHAFRAVDGDFDEDPDALFGDLRGFDPEPTTARSSLEDGLST